jgi:hypothetical protein
LGDNTSRRRSIRARGLSQKCEFAAKLIQNRNEPPRGCTISCGVFFDRTECFHDQIDWSVLQV